MIFNEKNFLINIYILLYNNENICDYCPHVNKRKHQQGN